MKELVYKDRDQNKAWIDGRSGLEISGYLFDPVLTTKNFYKLFIICSRGFPLLFHSGQYTCIGFRKDFPRLKFGSKVQPLKKAVLNPVSMAQLLTCTHFRDNLFHTHFTPFVIKSGFILWFAPTLVQISVSKFMTIYDFCHCTVIYGQTL